MRFFLLLCVIVLCHTTLFAQVKKMTAVRTDAAPKIDGILSDAVWQTAEVATDFLEHRPVPGRVERREKRTEIRILYDNSAIYIAARMYDHPDSIAREIVTRDKVGNSDFIGVVFDPYLDRINGLGFFVTAAGSQFDAKYSQTGNEDENWNAVWDSEVKIDDQGWTAEFKIPYSALRFSNKNEQTWGVNITRRRQKFNQQSFWNFVDPKVSGFINQEGELFGISNIKSPVRLSFSPYVSGLVNNYPYNQPGVKNTTSTFSGGMDVKYGINQAFTLDMTLVPDFGQVRSDNRVLNLTPFEVRFDENRQFFTEGTELFNKGDLFYSRRIGSFPAYAHNIYASLKPGEVVKSNPTESKLINATKISGRTGKGLGIGVFNAVTNRSFATVVDTDGDKRNVESQPLTSYNIIVLDQSLKHNSSVTLLNTNVIRQGSAYDANVSAFLFRLNNRKNRYHIAGGAKMSHISNDGTGKGSTGLSYEFRGGKQSGNFIWNVEHVRTDDKFDPTDLGFFTNNNFTSSSLLLSYNKYTPATWYNQFETWFEAFHTERYKPRSYQSYSMNVGAWMRFKNFWSANFNIDRQFSGNDFYEPRTAGRVFKTPASLGLNLNMNTNNAKKLSGGAYYSMRLREQFEGFGFSTGLWQNYRISNRLAVGTEITLDPRFNYSGWLGQRSNGDVIFSRYDRHTVEARIDAKYAFSSKMGIVLRGRHYWSDRRNKEYFLLQTDGSLSADGGSDFSNSHVNYNVFNIDMVYSWQFAPGSELSITYKDLAEDYEQQTREGYGQNFGRIIGLPQNNSVSVKVLYFLDYLQLRKKR